MACEIVQNWVGNFDNKFYYCRDHRCECPSGSVCGMQATQPVDPMYGVKRASVPMTGSPMKAHCMNVGTDVCRDCGLSGQEIYVRGIPFCKGATATKPWHHIDNLNVGTRIRANSTIPNTIQRGKDYEIVKVNRSAGYEEVWVSTDSGERLIGARSLPMYFDPIP